MVSVCVPCYNAEPYLEAAIKSVLAQSWANLEIIVVDDGSTDRSLSILQGLASERVKVISQQNAGQCAAANRAFAHARGDYIKFFDADDLLSPEFIESQMLRIRNEPDAVASARWGRFQGDDIETFQLNPEPVWQDMEAKDWLVESWINARPMMQCALWLIPREVLARAGGWDERLTLVNDFEFFARVLCHAQQVKFTENATLFYRSGVSGTLSGRKTRTAVESHFHSLMDGTGHLLQHRRDDRARRACANILQDFIYTYYPDHADLNRQLAARIHELGGSEISPAGGNGFQTLSKLVGWKLARRVQRLFGK